MRERHHGEESAEDHLRHAAYQRGMHVDLPNPWGERGAMDQPDQDGQAQDRREQEPAETREEECDGRTMPQHPCLLSLEEIEVVRRAVPVADRQAMANRFREVGLGGLDCVADRPAERKMRGDGGGERAAGAVGVRSLDEFPLEDGKEPAVVQQIGSPFSQQMTALDQDILAPETVDHLRCPSRIGQRLDFDAGQLLRFMHVRRDHQGEWKKPRFQDVDRVRFQERVAALGDHDRVDDEVGEVLRFQHRGYCFDNGGGTQHAGLHGGDVEIVEHGVDLGGDDRGRQFKDVRNLFRILGRNGRDHRHGEDAIGGHGFDVGLYPGASAGVGAGDGEHLFACVWHRPIVTVQG